MLTPAIRVDRRFTDPAFLRTLAAVSPDREREQVVGVARCTLPARHALQICCAAELVIAS
jgi:hypothetical protein